MAERSRTNRPVTTTESSIRILEVLKDEPSQTLDELTDRLDIARSTAHRHLLTLEENDLVVRDGNAFSLGLRFLDFGIAARNNVPFFEAARDHVDRLADETGEKVWLTAKEGHYSVHLYKASDISLQTSARVGQCRSLHQLASGKAILASLPERELHEILDSEGLEAVTEDTITDREVLFEELADVRDRGFAFNIGESIEGLNAVGAAIHDENDYPIGGVGLAGPANRVKGEYLEKELSDKLLATVDEIQINLRYAVNP